MESSKRFITLHSSLFTRHSPLSTLHYGLAEAEGTADRREGALLLVAAAFVLTNAMAYSLIAEGSITWSHLWSPLVWLVVMGIAYFLLSVRRPGHDPFLLPIVAILTGWGLILIDRLAVNFLGRQTVWLVLGVGLMLIIALIPRDLHFLQRYRYTWLISGLLLLVATFIFGVNPSAADAALWLPVPLPLAEPVYFQPSELLKVVMVVFLASYFADRETLLNRQTWATGFIGPLPYLLPLLLMWGFSIVLLVWQRDLGAATLFLMLFISLLYLATGEIVYVLGGLLLLLIAAVFAYFMFSDVVALRIDTWLQPWPEARDRAYQIVQSLYAIAAGGIGGQGVGQGYPDFVPVVHSDFAFAAIAEEWGLIATLVVVGCFAVLAQRGLRMAVLAERPFYAYLATGITIVFSAQAFLIMGGVTKLLPLTGITLPFVSYGGSSLLISSAMLGLLIYLSAPPSDVATPVMPATAVSEVQRRNPTKRLKRLGAVIFLGYLAVGLALVYWSVLRGGTILARDDNPRLVIAEQQIQRGRILDQANSALAITVAAAARTGAATQRQYPLPEAGPVVGYYSLRYGTAGIEAGYDAHLRGDDTGFWPLFRRGLLHQPPEGRDVRLTLDAQLQQAAANALNGRQGALVLLDVDERSGTAAIRAMVSAPGFDPNQLDAQFESLSADARAPLLNRAVQGRYQPGLMLQPLLVASAVDQEVIELDAPVANANQPVPLNGTTLQCQGDGSAGNGGQSPLPMTWGDVLALACPHPLEELAGQWDTDGLAELFEAHGLTRPPGLPINTQNTPPSPPPEDAVRAAIGQENLTVSPLQLALAFGMMVNNGRLPAAQLVEAVETESESWESVPVAAQPGMSQLVEPEVAHQVWQGLARDMAGNASPIAEHAVSVLAGPEGTTNSWYAGLTAGDSPTHYVLLLVLEGETGPDTATQIGRRVLEMTR